MSNDANQSVGLDVYMFVSDEAFENVASPAATVVSHSDMASDNNGVGVIDPNLLTYFVDPAVFMDPVGVTGQSARLTRCYKADEDLSGNNSNNIPFGKLKFHFDAEKVKNSGEFARELTYGFIQSESGMSDATKLTRLACLFNIVDTIFYARNNGDSYPKTQSAINDILSSADSLNANLYAGYVPNSLVVSNGLSGAKIRYIGGNNTLQVTSNERFYFDACSFIFSFTHNSVTYSIKFHAWLSSSAFKSSPPAGYKYSTCVQCIFPCEPERLLRPQASNLKYANSMEALVGSSGYIQAKMDDAITLEDHTGVVVIKSRYTNTGFSGDYTIGFAVLYKGCVPTTNQARDYVAKCLVESQYDGGTPIGTREAWKNVLPDLFVEGAYLLVPIYTQVYEQLGSATLGQLGIEKISTIVSKAISIMKQFVSLDDDQIYEKMELLQAPGSCIYIAAIATSADDNQKSIKELHPTYRPVDSTSGAVYSYMTEATKDFAIKLSECMAICLGNNEAEGAFSVEEGAFKTVTFSAGGTASNENYASYTVLAYRQEDWT